MTVTAERADAQPQSDTPVLEFDAVALSFAGVKAIDGVSFTVGGSELFAIIGPNGAGKTSHLQRAVRGVPPAVRAESHSAEPIYSAGAPTRSRSSV